MHRCLEGLIQKFLILNALKATWVESLPVFWLILLLVYFPQGRARGAKCEFIEQVNPESGYFSFKSALNPRWHVGFNQKGHGLLGSSYEDSECLECFLFHKTSFNTPARKHLPPVHLMHGNYDPHRHNQRIGGIHPGLNSDFLSLFPFSPPQSSNRRRPLPSTTTTTTTTTTTSTTTPKSTKQPSRHRLRHRKRKHRHQHHHHPEVVPTQTPIPIPNEFPVRREE